MTPLSEETNTHRCPVTYFFYEWDDIMELYLIDPTTSTDLIGLNQPEPIFTIEKYDWWNRTEVIDPKPGYEMGIPTTFDEGRLEEATAIVSVIMTDDRVIMAWRGEEKIWDMEVVSGHNAKNLILTYLRQ